MKYEGGSRCCRDYIGYAIYCNAQKIDQNLHGTTDENGSVNLLNRLVIALSKSG